MRRMMHAAILVVALSTGVQAQQSSLLVNGASGSPAYSSVGADATTIHSEYTDPGYSSGVQYGSEVATSEIVSGSPVAGPQFLPIGADRPYSAIAQRMQCQYHSPNLWATFPQERAALVAHMMRHVDGNCDCTRTYSEPCAQGGSCGKGCGPAIGNRYRVSTLYAEPTSDCSSGACGGCNTCGDSSKFGFSGGRAPLFGGRNIEQGYEVSQVNQAPVSPYLKQQQPVPAPSRTAAAPQPGTVAPGQPAGYR